MEDTEFILGIAIFIIGIIIIAVFLYNYTTHINDNCKEHFGKDAYLKINKGHYQLCGYIVINGTDSLTEKLTWIEVN